MEERIQQQAEKYRKHFKRLFYTDCTVTDCSEPFSCLRETKQPVFCEYCESIRGNGCCSMRTFQNGCAESYRWNTTCISLCSMGMVLMSSCLTEKNGNLCGGLTIGPLCMGNMEDILLDMPTGELRDMAMQMPLFTSAEVQSLSEILEAVTGYITGNMNSKASGYFLKQEEMLNALFTENIKKEAETDYYIYPVAQERKLRSAVQNQDREEAENILNQILAYMYQINHYSLELIRPRILELMIVLSRTAMDTGADMEMIDLLTRNISRQIDSFQNIEDLTAWVAALLQNFMTATFTKKDTPHAESVYKITRYIQKNYRQKIELQDVAEHLHMTKSYLCRFFKKETGETIINYTNRVRINNSKLLLADTKIPLAEVALLCGFEDQSYFTKVFRGFVGVTPRKYRENRVTVRG